MKKGNYEKINFSGISLMNQSITASLISKGEPKRLSSIEVNFEVGPARPASSAASSSRTGFKSSRLTGSLDKEN
jgi:hypothetical protein